ncbi:ATP-binding cassette domain-containing protein [Chryseomicrobium palamuruense]|uniref:ATP-binding cassette domain-containing protein n=1 Tax=Chryseomicrobium palamuruense TaxID=682973 RepID=A0ABV8US42_9BACL
MSKQPAIELKNVSLQRGEVLVLKGLTGQFPEGRITTIIGPSGAGKSTVLKLCNGLLSQDSGEVTILGKPLSEWEPAELRQQAGIALQSAPMISGTVEENLTLPYALHGAEVDVDKVNRMIQEVGLDTNYLQRDIRDLSGGQRQKVSIARTLLTEPAILLLDEITSALDRASRVEIEELIQYIHQTYGTTIIWITHNLEQAERIGHYTWVMMDGKLVEEGASELLSHSTNPQVQRFIKGSVS